MGSADVAQVPPMQLQMAEGTMELSLKMKSEYGCQFSNVDPKICELIYEANKHFRNMRRKHEYAHTPVGWKQFEEMMTNDVYNDGRYVNIARRSNSSERYSTPVPRTRRFNRRPSSADRALSAERRIPYGLNNYENYLNKDDVQKLTPKYASVQNKPRNSNNRPKVRIKLPPFVAYGGGCSSREIGDMKTYNINAANQMSKNGILKTNKSRIFDSENDVPLAKLVYRPMTASWLPKDNMADWKTEYRSNFCC